MSDVPGEVPNEECGIPVEVKDEENVVRAIFSHHLEKKKLRRTAFFERNDDVSVMRHTHMGTNECKRQALKVKPGNAEIRYKGLAVIGVGSVREAKSEVSDTREGNFCGHASMAHRIHVPPADDPLYAQQKLELDERLRQITRLAQYFPDPDPSAPNWTGPQL